MNKEIQPKLKETKVHCSSCGNKFTIKSMLEEFTLEVCNSCHPFYTGTQKSVQAAGRIDKFMKKYNIKEEK